MGLEKGQALDELLKEDETFSKLFKEHKEIDLKLKKLEKRKNLTPEEHVEAKRLKQLKLKKKDQMQLILESKEY